MSANELVCLEKVTKRYGQRTVIHLLDMVLREGECVALAGHNGAGKSTVMKLILGLISPTQGEVRLMGHQASGRQSVKLRFDIGYLPEVVSLYPNLTGQETLDFYAKLKQVKGKSYRDLLAKVGIANAAKQRVNTFSKGMRQRLALAQTLLGDPKIFLFDEPTTGLDPASRQQFYAIVRELRAQGATILLCTHALTELEGNIDRVMVMNQGQKVADGSLDSLRSDSGLDYRIQVKTAEDSPPDRMNSWQKIAPSFYRLDCEQVQKMSVLRSLMQNDQVLDVHTYAPSLDEIYAHYLEREDV